MDKATDSRDVYLIGTVLEQIIKYHVTATELPQDLGGVPLWQETPNQVLLVMFRQRQRHQLGLFSQHKAFGEYYREQETFSLLAKAIFAPEYQVRTLSLDGEPCCLLGVSAKETGNFELSAVVDGLRRLQGALRERLCQSYTAFVGEVEHYPEGLYASYRSAKYLMQYDEIMQTNRSVLLPKDIRWRVSDSSRIIAAERKYQNCINARDYKKASALAMELLSLETDASATNCINLKDRILARADAALDTLNISYDGNGKSESPVLKYFSQILQARTLREFRALLPLFYQALDAYSATLHSTSNNRVINFIRSNYDNPGLCARGICGEFQISYHNLARIINEYAGVGLVEFLHGLRLEEAKHLLQDTDAKIDVIAREVGYLSARTLNRAFIRYEEITPREYRRLHGKVNRPGNIKND